MAAVTIALAVAGDNIMKYKLTADGAAAGNLDAAGAVTPDLLTDCHLKAGTPMYDLLATTVADQAAARVLAFDRTDLKVSLLPRDADAAWIVDANEDGSDRLRLTFTAAAADAAGSYAIIEYRHSLVR